MEPKIVDILKDILFFADVDGDCFHITLDEKFELSSEQVRRIVESVDPLCELDEILDDAYREAIWCEEDYILEQVTNKLEECGFEFDEETVEETVQDFIRDHVFITPDTEAFLDQNVCVNITIDTGDGNHDFVLNKVYPAYWEDADTGIEDHASLVWLASTQGYSKEQLWAALINEDKNDSRFLESVKEEVINITSHMNVLIFLAKMTLRELIALNDNEFYTLSVPKDIVVGLFDPWNGAGSALDIVLEKPIKIPSSIIRAIVPDGEDVGYSVSSVYGMTDGAWYADISVA